jgi:hypothetical protein
MLNCNSSERNVIWGANCTHVRNLANVRLGVQQRRVSGVKLETGGEWLEPVVNIHVPISPTLAQIFYLPLFNSVVQKYSRLQKTYLGNWGHIFPAPLGPQVTPMLIYIESDSSSTSKDFLQHWKGHRLFYNSILG